MRRRQQRPVQVGSLEPVFATLEADVAVVEDPALPALPVFHINLQLPASGADAVALELAQCIRGDFARRYP